MCMHAQDAEPRGQHRRGFVAVYGGTHGVSEATVQLSGSGGSEGGARGRMDEDAALSRQLVTVRGWD